MSHHLTRRRFLNTTLAAAAALHVPPLPASESTAASAPLAGKFRPVDFSKVTLTDAFWRPKQEKVATATLAACIRQTEVETGRIRNFEKAARRKGEHEGLWFDDSDVYKAIEAMAYSLKNRPDAALEQKADEWIDKIAAAQLPDGYLNTYYTLKGLDGRWTDMDKHEAYCAGHLMEAAVAYYHTTGKRKLLDVAIRFADYLDETFRVPNRHWVPGHEEIEFALVKLYHVTGEKRYVQLAVWFLQQRGHGYGQGTLWGKGKDLGYCQDHLPVKDQRKIRGHAVRAMYLYSGAADVGAVTGDTGYMQAMISVWHDVVYRNMYVTGGIGTTGKHNEGFSEDYDLPNEYAYCETCASCGMVFWNQRMAQLTGESQYVDVLERSLYNGALDGLSLSGDRFFYGNPLASTGGLTLFGEPGRKAWFGVACCPSNISRLVASLGGYLYGASDRGIWVNLFVGSTAQVKLGETDIELQVDTNYPWEGRVKLTLNSATPLRSAIHLRIPGWAKNTATPGDLYRFTSGGGGDVTVRVNGKVTTYKEAKGYAVLEREWQPGDVIELELPMDIRRVVARQEVEADRGRVALQRGPLVYCVEGTDNAGHGWNFILPDSAVLSTGPHRVLDESVVAIRGEAKVLQPAEDGLGVQERTSTLTAIPYYSWANRHNYEMQVWLPTRINEVKVIA